MKKTEKLSILISIVLISLLAISAVSAAETDDTTLTQTSNDGAVSEPSTTDVQVKDTQDTTTTKESSSTDTVKATEPGTFTDLNNDINKPFEQTPNTNTINLTKDYKYDAEKDTGLDNGITFSTSELNGHTITVDGKGHTISGEDGASIFQIVYKNMDVTLKNLIIENARKDFATITVNKDTKLTLINVTFTGNQGTSVIENNGTLTIEDSTFDGNSYNIYSLGGLSSTLSTWDVIIKNTTFTNNYGIATFVNSSVKIINSTFYHNWNGIEAVNSSLTIEDTIFNATGGLGIEDSDLVMNTVKFVELNMNEQTAIEAYTCGILMNDVEFIRGNYAIEAYNSTIESHNSKFINNTQDAITTAISELKIFDGLFEGNDEAILLMLSNATIVGTNFTDNGNGEADYGDTAIGGFNSNINLAEVMFINNTYGAIELLNGNLTIEDVYFINSTDDNAITARIANITINEAYFENNAEAIDFINGALNITDGYFINNTNGAILASKADIIIDGAEFEDNDGSIDLYNGTLDVTDTYFINNTDDAIDAEMANIKLDGVYFEDNDYEAIDLYNGTLDVTDTYFINNTYGAIGAEMADIFIDGGAFVDNGLAIGLYNGTLDVTDAYFINNTYGAIIAQLANVTVSDSLFKYNGNGKALEDIIAGAIYFDNVDGKLTVFDSEFTNNTAKYGGAIYSNGNTTIDGINTFTNNTANYGGAILINGGNADIMGVFEGNTAKKDGGAIANNKGTVEIIGYFQGNIASAGGAIYNNGFMNITNSIFETNNATGNGGAIYHNNRAEKSLIIKDTTFTNDYAPGSDDDDNDQAREIYVKHYNDNSDDQYAHNRIARLTNVNITNTFNYRSNKEDEPYANDISCEGCVYGDYHTYNMIPTFNITVLNNVHNKTVLYITLLDNNGEIISTVAYQWIDDDYTEQRKVLPFTFNVTGDINDLVANGVPYTNGTLSVGEHTITITYGGEDYWFTGDYHRFNIDDAWDYHFQVPKTSVTIKFNVTKTVEELEKEVADEEAIARNLAAQLEAAKQQVADLEKQLETAKGNASDLDKQLQAAKQQVANLTAQLNATNTELTTTKAALDNANNQINTLTITNNNLQSQLTAANNKADDANAKIKKVKAPKKVKKSKKLKITVTLSKKINGKYVYVIFNGKAYKAKAKKGVAKITIKKSALKKLGGKKVKYQIVYNQSIKNKTVKVKK